MTLPAADLDLVLEHARDDFSMFRGARLLVTGGTGFVGTWLVETFLDANRRLGLGASIVVLTRDAAGFARKAPQATADPALRVLAGDVRDRSFASETVDAIIHAATPASATVNADMPDLMLDTILAGGRNVLAFAERCGRIPLLFTSSGAVYGRQPPQLGYVGEDYLGGPDPLLAQNAYHEGKRCAELQCAIAAKRGIDAKIARLFAFIGPHLPIDRHFAIGNFIRDRLAGDTIAVNGDGSALRSYLYAADMAIWLWRIFARGTALRAYNVGSEQAVSIADAATRVAAARLPLGRVSIAQLRTSPAPPERYIPSTARARGELGLVEWTPLDTAIDRTLSWHAEQYKTHSSVKAPT